MGARRLARELAMRVLYQCEASGDKPSEAAEEVIGEVRPGEETAGYLRRLVETYARHAGAVESEIRGACRSWKLERMAAVDRNVLKVGTVELLFFAEVPARVVIDEAVEVARKYGTEESDRFVNGVLDAVARRCRPQELRKDKGNTAKPA